MADEDQAIQRCLQGDKEAFQDIVEAYKGYVFAIVLNFISDRNEAENIAQEVFLQIFSSLSQYGKGSFKAWIGKIAVNKAMDWKRTQGRLAREIILTQRFDAKNQTNGDFKRYDPEEILLTKEKKLRVRETCAQLPEVYGRTMIKYFIEEKSYREIALEERVTVKTVESRLYRAKKLFRANWGEDI